MKTLIVLIFFSLISSITFGQRDFRPGYIITLTHDTIAGTVQYRSNTKSYKGCTFDNGVTITDYNATQLSGYGFFNDKYYPSGIVKDEFVEMLVGGKMSLYKHNNVYFIRKTGDDKFHRVEANDVTAFAGTRAVKVKDQKWRGLLSALSADCSKGNDTREMKLTEKEMTAFVIAYNQCALSSYAVFKSNKPWSKLEFGLSAGIQATTLNTSGSAQAPFLLNKYTSIDPTFGFTFDVTSPRLGGRVGIHAEAMFTKLIFAGLAVAGNQYHDVLVRLTTLSIPIGPAFHFPGEKLQVQIMGGLNIDHHLRSETKLISETVSGSVVYTYESEAFSINRNQIGYWAALTLGKTFGDFRGRVNLKYVQAGQLSHVERAIDASKLSVSLIVSKL